MAQSISVTYENEAQHNGNNIFVQLTSLEQAIEQIKTNLGDYTESVAIIEDLADYITDFPSREVIGLEKKLDNGGRKELKDRAVLLKSRFERRVAKNQMSLSEQHVYIQILSAISTIWHSKIAPLIENNAATHQIDQTIFDELVEPIHKAIVRYDTLITTDLVSGMLYFLTGKCHIQWSKQC